MTRDEQIRKLAALAEKLSGTMAEMVKVWEEGPADGADEALIAYYPFKEALEDMWSHTHIWAENLKAAK